MTVVIVRLDLDRYELDVIEGLIVDDVVGIGEVMDCLLIREMSEFDRLMWVRKVQIRRFGHKKVG